MVAKISALLMVTVFGICRAEPPSSNYGTPLGAPLSSYGTPNYNANDDHNHEYGEPKAYEFAYQVKDDYTGNNHNRQESSDGNQVRGEYRVLLPDGRTQIVTYYADWQTGFHADVKYEGTAQYPDQYNNNGYNNGGYNNGGYNNNNGGYNYNNNNNNNNGGYNNVPSGQYGTPNYNNNNHGGSASSSVVINKSNNNNNLNQGYNYNNPNSGGPNRPSFEYGAP